MDSYNGGIAAGEVRRINVVYFLSRGGKTEHPHLIRVRHLHRAGVRLRDVKSWLSELRGKDMPDNFSWSYKRKYRTGYVWQDLMDDDLITPISDNEYVIKGCDLPRTPNSAFLDEKKPNEREDKIPFNEKLSEEIKVTVDAADSSPPPPPINQDLPGGKPVRHTIAFKIDLSQDTQQKQKKQQQKEEKAVVKAAARAPEGGGEGKQSVGCKSRTMRVSSVFHNILTCGAADTDDTALRPIRAQTGEEEHGQRTPRCPGIDGCGFQKGRPRRGGKKRGKRDGGKGSGAPLVHKPATLPRCSQCGKEFKPQELHSHMQSCRALKERMRSSSNGSRISIERNSITRLQSNGRPSSASAVFLLTES